MTKDVRKEQLVLLRFEKQIAGLAATLAAGAALAKSVDSKLEADAASQSLAEVQDALMQLAQATGKAHDALNASAIEAGARMLNVTGGGLPKTEPPAVVSSILGLG